ncbi:metal/formaldehyde-sensitive transcriptional repressor [Dongia sp.]|uniref:metal/formaldehyde-sensitive transcriptional repressor n=1 Tax=Dongia sp. TaxID=1977262 RepID=UPI00375256EA
MEYLDFEEPRSANQGITAPWNRESLLARIRRIGGQVTAIENAVYREAGCSAILHQVAGARGALAGLTDQLIEALVREQVSKPGLSQEQREAGAADLIAAVRRYAK